MKEIVVLGTGGGRFATITQMRATGGIRLGFDNIGFYIDPGPGTLVQCKRFRQNPQKVDGIFVSHVHPDHSNDVNAMIEAMTHGMTKNRGTLVSTKAVIDGFEGAGPVVTPYHKKQPGNVLVIGEGEQHTINEVEVRVLKAKHSAPDTVGFSFNHADKHIVYSADTEYFEGISEQYKGADILILNVLRPEGVGLPGHLSTEDAIKIGKEAKPKLIVIQHFGMKMLQAGPAREAQKIQRETGIRTIAAEDGMRLSLEETDQKMLEDFKQ